MMVDILMMGQKMGYSKADKAQSHERIVRTAAIRFREKGIDGISVADLMNEAGLTHGGFYRHFESREDLVAQAVACALAGGEGSVACDFEAEADLGKCVEIYLSEAHRDNPGGGCAMTALAGDVARAGAPARELYAKHVARLAGLFAAKMDPDVPEAERRANALFIVSSLAGALSLARAVGDPQLSTEILAVARERLVGDLGRSGVVALSSKV